MLAGVTDTAGDRDALQEQSIREIAAGGLPVEATRRLEGIAQARRQKGFCFTSDLTVNEFAMLRGHRIRPITQVMGSSVFNMGSNVRQASLQAPQPDREQAAEQQCMYPHGGLRDGLGQKLLATSPPATVERAMKTR